MTEDDDEENDGQWVFTKNYSTYTQTEEPPKTIKASIDEKIAMDKNIKDMVASFDLTRLSL